MNALDITLAIIVALWLLYVLWLYGFWSYVWRWIKYDNESYRHDLERQWYNDQARIAAATVKRERKNAKRLELESIFREVHCDWNKPPGCHCLKLADAQRCCERCDEP